MDSQTVRERHSPPLMETTTFGIIQYLSGPYTGQTASVDMHGTMKQFSLADGEWTCYKRNFFSCTCSFGLAPFDAASGMAFLPNNSTKGSTIDGFAMCISAVASNGKRIELVQCSSSKLRKDEKGSPKKVRLLANPCWPTSHNLVACYEHTFERIRFRTATTKRTAQTYHRLLVELWASVSSPENDEQYVKVAQRMSPRLVVRGPQPGYYAKPTTLTVPENTQRISRVPLFAPSLQDVADEPSIGPWAQHDGGYLSQRQHPVDPFHMTTAANLGAGPQSALMLAPINVPDRAPWPSFTNMPSNRNCPDYALLTTAATATAASATAGIFLLRSKTSSPYCSEGYDTSSGRVQSDGWGEGHQPEEALACAKFEYPKKEI